MFFVKFIFSFTASFIILSIPVEKRPLFYHIHEVVMPIAEGVFAVVKKEIKQGFYDAKSTAVSFFSNTHPKEDRIQGRASSTFKDERYDNTYTDEEREILRRVMQDGAH